MSMSFQDRDRTTVCCNVSALCDSRPSSAHSIFRSLRWLCRYEDLDRLRLTPSTLVRTCRHAFCLLLRSSLTDVHERQRVRAQSHVGYCHNELMPERSKMNPSRDALGHLEATQQCLTHARHRCKPSRCSRPAVMPPKQSFISHE